MLGRLHRILNPCQGSEGTLAKLIAWCRENITSTIINVFVFRAKVVIGKMKDSIRDVDKLCL